MVHHLENTADTFRQLASVCQTYAVQACVVHYTLFCTCKELRCLNLSLQYLLFVIVYSKPALFITLPKYLDIFFLNQTSLLSHFFQTVYISHFIFWLLTFF
jgi:hypothetical protein